ncbi:MAG: hypothetical protein FWH10_00615 [Oscillospiraceae bacterium]|nr:hypothetical protein [Oscillospiraceae bacterium]
MFNNRRVEEDLERIRRANLSPEQFEEEEKREREMREAVRAGEVRVTVKDIVAMTIAIFSLILPYLAVFAAGIALVLFLFLR